jgi:sorbitol-specific phosphotransferase system component IIC
MNLFAVNAANNLKSIVRMKKRIKRAVQSAALQRLLRYLIQQILSGKQKDVAENDKMVVVFLGLAVGVERVGDPVCATRYLNMEWRAP